MKYKNIFIVIALLVAGLAANMATNTTSAFAEDKSVKAGESVDLKAGWLCKGDLVGYFAEGNEGGTRGNLILVTGDATLGGPGSFGANCMFGERSPESFIEEMLAAGCSNGCKSVAVWCAPAKREVAVVTNVSGVSSAVAACGWQPGSTFAPVYATPAPAAVAAPPASSPVQAQPVRAAVTPATGDCTATPGFAVPAVVETREGILCGSWDNVAEQPFLFGGDFALARNSTNNFVPGGTWCSGDLSRNRTANATFYRGGFEGERDAVVTQFIYDVEDVDALWGADCRTGGRAAMQGECKAKLAERDPRSGQFRKDRCIAFYDP